MDKTAAYAIALVIASSALVIAGIAYSKAK